jgi:hypothetical protein
MVDKDEPGKNTKDSNLPDDDEIIELTDAVEDDIIELSDIAESVDAGEDIIDLMDAVEEEEIIDLTDTAELLEEEEEPLDLMDVVEEEEVIDLTDTAELLEEEEEPLDLMDVVEEEEVIDLTDTAEPLEEEEETIEIPSISGKVDEALIELVEEINSEARADHDSRIDSEEDEHLKPEEDFLDADDEIELLGEDVSGVGHEIESQFAESLDLDLDAALEVSEKDFSDEHKRETRLDHKGVMTVKVKDMRKEGAPIDFKFESRIRPGDTIVKEKEITPRVDSSVSPEQVEKVIERVVREMLTEKIDGLLAGIIEKTVSEEIKKIKGVLLKDMGEHEV